MSLLNVNLEDRMQLKILPDNTEAKIRVVRAEIAQSKSDYNRFNLALVLEVPDDPMVDDIRVWLPIPTQDQKEDDPKRYVKQVDRIREFCEAFTVSMPVEVATLIGLEGWAILREEVGLEGTMQNSVRRFLARR